MRHILPNEWMVWERVVGVSVEDKSVVIGFDDGGHVSKRVHKFESNEVAIMWAKNLVNSPQ